VPETTGVLANRNSRLFHKPTCKGVAKMKDANKVMFDSVQAAEKAGYRKVGDCSK
jgi:methylphosphotriester-DNA--protein-cysteine methyltransferase